MAVWRELLALPWLAGALRNALAVLALALAMMAMDAPAAVWALWWPLVLGGAAVTLALQRQGQAPLAWRELGCAAAGLALLMWRALASLTGPLPAQGLREVQAALLIGVVVWVLWSLGRQAPRHVLAIWSLALAFAWISLLVIRHKTLDYAPAWEGSLVSLVACGGVAWWARRLAQRIARDRAPRHIVRWDAPRTSALVINSLFWVALGAAWAAFDLARLRRLPALELLALTDGQLFTARLWTQSVLFGWGSQALPRLAQALAEPHRLNLAPWGGPFGLLAQWGVLGVGMFVLALSWFIRRRVRQIGLVAQAIVTPVPLAIAAGPVALLFAGWVLVSGARGSVPWCLLAGWVALSLIPPRRMVARDPRQDFALRSAPATVLGVGWVALAGLLLLPTLGGTLQRGASESKLGAEGYRDRLLLAWRLNPYDANIPLNLALSLRRSLSQSQTGGRAPWSESAYLRVLAYYNEAARLNPYETLIPMREAQFQVAFDRQEEALATIEQALVRQPNSRDLLGWLLAASTRFENLNLARQVLARSLRLQPEDPFWWQWSYLLARRVGQGSAASDALNLLLTSDPGNPAIINAALDQVAPALPLPE
jgi:hypothetical protein